MDDKTHLMIKISRLYYENGLTQEAISRKLRLSRPTVSRLLQEALDLGIVKISITPEPGNYTEIERELETRYNLIEAVVVDTSNPDSREVVLWDLGAAAAKLFSRIVQDGDMVGLTWGLTLSAMVDQLQYEKKRNLIVAQMIGGLGEPDAETHATDLVRRIAIATGATLRLLPAPGIVSTLETARLLRSEPYIAQALEMMNKVDIAFAGIGAPTDRSLLMREEKIIKWSEIKHLVGMGAVGEIGLQFYDVEGNLVHSDLDERVIGISLEMMRSVGRRVGVAGGSEKFEAILGAVRGCFINTLVTDMYTARKLLEVAI